MGFFSFRQEIAMDLGTANTIIICDDKIVVDVYFANQAWMAVS